MSLTEKLQKLVEGKLPNPDYVKLSSNMYFSITITGTDLLSFDNPALLGVPFLFFSSTYLPSTAEGVHHFAPTKARDITRGFSVGNYIPKIINMKGIELETEGRFLKYVPYSLGYRQDLDIANAVRVRTSEEYQQFVREILPAVRQLRTQRIENSKPKNRILRLFGKYPLQAQQ